VNLARFIPRVYIFMARTKRSRHKIESDRVEISRLYLQNFTQSQIAKKLGMTQPMVSYDLAAIHKNWQMQTTIALDAYLTAELQRLSLLQHELWRAWEISKQDYVRKDGDKEIRVTRDGNPRFLNLILSCIAFRSRLLGFQNIEAHDIIKPQTTEPKVVIYRPRNNRNPADEPALKAKTFHAVAAIQR
jgi:hypothetical protein